MAARTLYLIRHAKAEEYSFLKTDFDRDIVTKGEERAQAIARTLSEALTVDRHTLFLSSSANRAIQTAEIFATILGYPTAEIRQDKSIYEAHHLDILQAINQVEDTVTRLLVFGHNPGLSMLTEYLTDDFVDLKTSHVAAIKIEGLTFAELSGSTAQLEKVFQ